MVNNYSMQENNHIDRSDLIVVNAQRKAVNSECGTSAVRASLSFY